MIWIFYAYLVIFAMLYMSAVKANDAEYNVKIMTAKIFALYGGIVVGTATILSVFV